MAKSLRSKRKRKLRSVKREKYAKKELAVLKGIVEKAKETENEMKELYTLKSPAQMKPVKKKKEDGEEEEEVMDTTKPKQVVNPKTLKTAHGNYAVWMNQKQIKKKKKELKKAARERHRKRRQQIHI